MINSQNESFQSEALQGIPFTLDDEISAPAEASSMPEPDSEEGSASEARHEALDKLKAAFSAYLEVGRHELDEALRVFGRKLAFGTLAAAGIGMGLAWLSVTATAALAASLGWVASSAIVGGSFLLISVVGVLVLKKKFKEGLNTAAEIGNAALNEKVRNANRELEGAVTHMAKETLHDVRPDVVLGRVARKHPEKVIMGLSGLVAAAAFGVTRYLRKA